MGKLQDVLSVAAAEVGYQEKKSNAQLDEKNANAGSANYTKYARDYAAWGWGNYQAQPWCDVFVSWCFRKAGLDDLAAGHNSYCPSHVNWFKNKLRWYASKPQAGDVIFYKDSSGVACHVGIVEKVEGGNVHTIEGNTSGAAGVVADGGQVARKSYALDYARILGYGRPDYGKDDDGLMSKEYDELKGKIDALTDKIDKLSERLDAASTQYNYIDENMPAWARPTIQKLVNKGLLKGDEYGLGLTASDLKQFVINDRAGLYD
jgi:hypothetical protein